MSFWTALINRYLWESGLGEIGGAGTYANPTYITSYLNAFLAAVAADGYTL